MKHPTLSMLPIFERDTRSLMYAIDLKINGRTLMDYGADPTDGIVRVGDARPRTSMTEVPGRAGSLDLSLTDETGRAYEPRRTLEFDAVIVGDGLEAIETKIRLAELNGIEVTISWDNLPGQWHGRCRVGQYKDTFLGRRFAKSVVTFTVDADPYLHGAMEFFSIDTTPAILHAHGNRPSPPIIRTIPPAGTKRLYITVNDRQLVYNLEADGVKTLVADCGMRRTAYGDAPVFPSIDSDYPMLIPGENTANITAGTATVSYTQRIMI